MMLLAPFRVDVLLVLAVVDRAILVPGSDATGKDALNGADVVFGDT
jgi:hypothetical protein